MPARITRRSKSLAETILARHQAAKVTRRRKVGPDFGEVWASRGRGPEPVTEHRFHEHRKWRFDWAWLAPKVAVEYEGNTFATGGKSRHTTGSGHHEDCDKYNAAAVRGWCVLRYTRKHLDQHPDAVCAQVAEAIRSRLTRTEA